MNYPMPHVDRRVSSVRPVVLITGASRGIGRGIAVEAAARGYAVVVNYVGNTEAAESCVAQCREAAGAGGDEAAIAVRADIALAEDRERLVRETVDRLGRIDALVNNAGVAPAVRAAITEAGEESFERLMRINLQGPHFLTQAVVRHWTHTGRLGAGGFRPKIVFIGSISATAVSVNRADYCISKAGLAMAAKLWAVQLAPHDVGVFEIRPGITDTDMTAAVKEKYDRLIDDGIVPQRRWGQPADTARIVRAILDGDFAYSTGSVIYSDGGFHVPRL